MQKLWEFKTRVQTPARSLNPVMEPTWTYSGLLLELEQSDLLVFCGSPP